MYEGPFSRALGWEGSVCLLFWGLLHTQATTYMYTGYWAVAGGRQSCAKEELADVITVLVCGMACPLLSGSILGLG